MKNIISILLSTQFLSVFFLFVSREPHCHNLKSIDNSNSKIKMTIFCTHRVKYYHVCGIEKNDAVYITSTKIRNSKKYFLTESFESESQRSYKSIISDLHFHRNISNDTVTLKIEKQNSTISVYKFLVLKNTDIDN